MNLSALKKILGEGASAAKGMGSIAKGAGSDLMGAMKAKSLAGLGDSAKYSAGQLGNLVKEKPMGSALVGAGALGAGGAGAAGIHELLEKLGLLDDEEDM